MADDPPVSAEGDDVDAVPPEPRAFVESVGCRPGELQPRVELQDRALRRRASDGKLEQHRLPHDQPTEADDARRHTQLEAVVASRTGDDHDGRPGLADMTGEHAPVERVEASASPPPPRQEQGQRQRGTPTTQARPRMPTATKITF